MVSLEGIGGIGKTAVARAFVAQPDLSANWPEILWVSARQSFLAEDGSLMSCPGFGNHVGGYHHPHGRAVRSGQLNR